MTLNAKLLIDRLADTLAEAEAELLGETSRFFGSQHASREKEEDTFDNIR